MLSAEEITLLVQNGEGYNVDFKRAVPQKVRDLTEEVCGFANSSGGFLLIGVNDKNEIIGTDIDNVQRSTIQSSLSEISPAVHCEIYSVKVEGKAVWVIDVPSGNNKPYFYAGSAYIRQGTNCQKITSADEIRQLFQTSNKVYYDAASMPHINLYDGFDTDFFESFRQEARLSGSVTVQQILENLQVFDDEGNVKRGGILFFDKHPERYFPQAMVRCVLFKGIDKVYMLDDKEFGGPLPVQYFRAIEWLQSKLRLRYNIHGSMREEEWEIPVTALREAVVNALSHRDYYEQGACITIEMFDDRVEISNPGGLLPMVAKDFGKRSLSRNPLIFGLFTRMHLVERIGSGIPRMRKEMTEAGLPEPELHTEGMFTVIFRRPLNATVQIDRNDIRLSARQKAIIDIIREQPEVTYETLAKTLDITSRTIAKDMAQLVEWNFIKRKGTRKKGCWELNTYQTATL